MPIAIRSQITSTTGADSTAHRIFIPTHSEGDRLVIVAAFDGTNTTITAGLSGWTALFVGRQCVGYEKVGNGAESHVDVTSSVSEQMAAACYAISGAHASTASHAERLDRLATDDTTYRFPALSITRWADEEALFIAGFGLDENSTAAIPAGGFSAGFSELTAKVQSSVFTTRVSLLTQARIATANTIAPTDWTSDKRLAATGFVIAVRPSASPPPPLVTSYAGRSQFNAGIN